MSIFDNVFVVVYFVAMIACGIILRGRQESAEDYFAGGGLLGGRISRIMVGLSIAATYFSGISFIAIPSIAIANGTKIFLILAVFPVSWVVVEGFFLRRYLAFPGLHPYGIVAARLGPRVRQAISALFVLLRLGWMAALLYAPTILILTTMRLGNHWFWPVVLSIGVSSTVYTVLGGLRGVIVTDAIQMIIIMVGLVFVVVLVLVRIPFDPSLWLAKLSASGSFTTPSLSLSLTEQFTVWGILVGMSVSNLASSMADQISLQRFLATGSYESARKSFRYSLAGSAITVALLVAIGLLVTLYYSFNPDPILPKATDQIFPHFVASALPSGLRGLIVAAILAATMSSVTSGINALAGCLTIDFIRPTRRGLSERSTLTLGRWASLGVGLGATLLAGMISDMGTIFNISQTVLGVFMGPILAIVTIAAANVGRVSETRCLWAIAVGCLVGMAVAFSTAQSVWITVSGLAATLVLGFPLPGGTIRPREQSGR